jgi:hypothetical protein
MSVRPSTAQRARILVGFDATDPITAPEMTLNEAVQGALGRQAQERLLDAAPALAGFGPWRPLTTGAVPAARGLHQLSVVE